MTESQVEGCLQHLDDMELLELAREHIKTIPNSVDKAMLTEAINRWAATLEQRAPLSPR